MSTNLEPAAARQTRPRPFRASTYFLVIAVFLSVAGALYLWKGAGTRYVYTATQDLPAYHQITELDVRRTAVRSAEAPTNAAAHRETLLGRYTLVAVNQDAPFDTSRLGPLLPRGRLTKARILAVGASPSNVIGGRLARGDLVNILLAQRHSNATQGGRLPRVLVLDVPTGAEDPAQNVVILAISASNEDAFLAGAGDARTVLVRAAAYRRP